MSAKFWTDGNSHRARAQQQRGLRDRMKHHRVPDAQAAAQAELLALREAESSRTATGRRRA